MAFEQQKPLYVNTVKQAEKSHSASVLACDGPGSRGIFAAVPAPCIQGLVSSKTSPLEIKTDKATRDKNRIKRLRRAVWSSGHLHGLADVGHRPPVAHFVTLTYVGVNDWRADHISDATEQFRRHCARLGVPCRYLWVAELQKRGAVHYHLIAWLPARVRMPHWDRTRTANGRTLRPFWAHGMTNVEVARNGIGYLMKYLSKLGDDTVFPPHLRLYGCGGLDAQARTIRGWYNLPQWAKNEYGVGDLKRQGSRLIVVETGEIVPPMYARTFTPGIIILTPLRDIAPRLHHGAYSTLDFSPCAPS